VRDQDPRRTARRRAHKKDRFANNNFCLFCGYACLEALTIVSRQWLETKGVPAQVLGRLLERHHIHGKAHDPNLVITLCLNCHREITEGLMREGVIMYPQKKARKLVTAKLRASAVLLDSLASSCRDSASLLEESDEP
jgi:hypothetical protein